MAFVGGCKFLVTDIHDAIVPPAIRVLVDGQGLSLVDLLSNIFVFEIGFVH